MSEPTRALRVCVVARRALGYSETFIAAHLARLPAECELLHADGGRFSLFGSDGGVALDLAPGELERLRGADLRAAEPAYRAALARYLRTASFDAVLAEYGTTGARAYAGCAAAGVPLVVHFHGYDAFKGPRVDPLREDYRAMFGVAAALIAVSRPMVERLVELGAPRDRIALCPSGVDLDRFAGVDPAAAPARFVAVGRFVEKKGPELTVRAFARALTRAPEARLVLAGDGPLLAPCRELAHSLGVAHAVELPGPLAHEKVADLLCGARAFVQHSRRAADGDSEGTPVAILEAAAAGLPVVATRHGGIPEAVLDGRTGILVDELDWRAMGDAIAALARDPERAAALGRAARAHAVAHYSIEEGVARLWRVISNAAHGACRATNTAAAAAHQ